MWSLLPGVSAGITIYNKVGKIVKARMNKKRLQLKEKRNSVDNKRPSVCGLIFLLFCIFSKNRLCECFLAV